MGICLKRYDIVDGRPIRLNTRVDIPIEIGLPHFIQDDKMDEAGPIYGNFKLSLQSVVCHRGNSVHSGHYIALARTTNAQSGVLADASPDSLHWMRFDDLASQRITLTDVEKALKEETPYLLFYQIVPIDGDPGRILDSEVPPAYSESREPGSGGEGSTTSLTLCLSRHELSPTGQPSIEITGANDSRSLVNGEARRASISFSEPMSASKQVGVVSPDHSSRPPTRVSSPTGRESQSLGPTQNKSGEGLAKGLSRLAGGKAKESSPVEATNGSEVRVQEIPNSVSKTGDARLPVASQRVISQKQNKREKSRSRLSKHGAGKLREDKPERECLVM